MASPTYYLTIVDKKKDELLLEVSACNHPNQTVPEKKYFVWLAILDAFTQRFKSVPNLAKLDTSRQPRVKDPNTNQWKQAVPNMEWKKEVVAYSYTTLFQLHLHCLEQWLGDIGDTDDLSYYEEVLVDWTAEYENDAILGAYCKELATYPRLSELIEAVTVVSEGLYKLDEEGDEELRTKVLKIKVSDTDFIAHCEKGASWEIYWW